MNEELLKITVLGTGTSQGVPVIACECDVCQSEDIKDKRLRTSIMITYKGVNYVIDTGPDFRQQMLREDVKRLRAIIYTHEHKDHIAGLDDVRAFNYVQKSSMDIYCDKRVEKALKREFYYAFEENPYSGVPKLKLNIIDKNTPFTIEGLTFHPIEVIHKKLPVIAYRIKDFVYITDAKTIAKEEKEKIKGCEVLFVNALREEEHISHFNLKEALAFIEEIQPKKAYITHISHLFAKHKDIEAKLPKNVFAAYDGLQLEI